MPPIKPMPSAAAPRQTDPDYHKDCAAQFAQGVAPWTPAARVPVEPINTPRRVLGLAGNRIADLWPLAGVTALERLNLSDNRIADLWPLAGLTGLNGLEVLLLDGNRVTDVRALAQMAGLANLGLSGNPIADLWPLTGLS